MLKILKNNKELTAIFVLALLLRLVGFWHGFPVIFNVDEPALVRSALSLRFDLNPKHFDWPHLHFYLNYVLYFMYIKFRGLLLDYSFLKETLLWRDPLIFYYLSRIFNGILGALTVIPLFYTAKTLYDKRTAVLAALLFAVFTLHVRTSHFALIDVPTTFWLTVSVFFASKLLYNPNYKNYMLSGLFAGLAMSTKYNGLFASLALIAMHLSLMIRNRNVVTSKEFYLMPLSALIMCLVGFFIGTPFALFDHQTFLRNDGPKGALWQFSNVGNVRILKHVFNFFITSPLNLVKDLGYTPFILFVLFMFVKTSFIIKHKQSKDITVELSKLLFITIPALVIIYNVSGYVRTRSHYYMPAYPFIALGGGVFLASLKRTSINMKLALITVLVPLFFSLYQVAILSIKDTRILAYEYLERAKPKNLIYRGEEFSEVAVRFNKEAKVIRLRNTLYLDQYSSGLFVHVIPSNKDAMLKETSTIPLPKILHIDNTFRNGPAIDIYVLDPITYEAN